MRPSRDTDAMKSRAHLCPNSHFNSLQFRLKNPVHAVKQRNDRARQWWSEQKKDWSTARVVDKELITKQKMDSDSQFIKLLISLMDVFASNISELHREGPRFHGSSQRFRTAAHRLKTASFIVNTPYRCFTRATGQSPARGSAVNSKGEKACQQQSPHAHLDDRCVGERKSLEEHVLVFPKVPDSHRFREVSFVDVNFIFH